MQTQKKILLVDDYESNTFVAGLMLEELGYAYDCASTGLEAIDKIKQGGYTAVLMDIEMPGMNGLEATKIIREWEQENGIRVPIIGMTAHALSGDREKCFSAGMDDYLSKPVTFEKLRVILDMHSRR